MTANVHWIYLNRSEENMAVIVAFLIIGLIISSLHCVSLLFFARTQRLCVKGTWEFLHQTYLLIIALSLSSIWTNIGITVSFFLLLAVIFEDTNLGKAKQLERLLRCCYRVVLCAGIALTIYALGKLNTPDKGQALALVTHDFMALMYLPLATALIYYGIHRLHCGQSAIIIALSLTLLGATTLHIYHLILRDSIEYFPARLRYVFYWYVLLLFITTTYTQYYFYKSKLKIL